MRRRRERPAQEASCVSVHNSSKGVREMECNRSCDQPGHRDFREECAGKPSQLGTFQGTPAGPPQPPEGLTEAGKIVGKRRRQCGSPSAYVSCPFGRRAAVPQQRRQPPSLLQKGWHAATRIALPPQRASCAEHGSATLHLSPAPSCCGRGRGSHGGVRGGRRRSLAVAGQRLSLHLAAQAAAAARHRQVGGRRRHLGDLIQCGPRQQHLRATSLRAAAGHRLEVRTPARGGGGCRRHATTAPPCFRLHLPA